LKIVTVPAQFVQITATESVSPSNRDMYSSCRSRSIRSDISRSSMIAPTIVPSHPRIG